MPCHLVRLGLACCVGALSAALASGQQPGVESSRKGGVVESSLIPAESYRKKWAVIVGTNYRTTEREPLKRGSIGELKHAENDAREFGDVLLKYYGYQRDEVIALIGREATFEALSRELDNRGRFFNKEKVGPDDSVLFYFSGHGFLEQSGDGRGNQAYVLPWDVSIDGNEPRTSTAFNVGALVRELIYQCPARHKLLILDCCHSGWVFRINGAEGGKFEHRRADSSLFRFPAIQAMTASRESQVAWEGGPGENHSPFTAALLRAMKSIPRKISREQYRYTANVLFDTMNSYLDSNLPPDQSPQCKWLDGNQQGEFHFYPDPAVEFPEEVMPEDWARKLLVAMVPSTFGNWWADEMPWFMPSLRFSVLEVVPAQKSALPDIDKERLRQAALQTLSRLATEKNDLVKKRLEHLQMWFAPDCGRDREDLIQRLVKSLQEELIPKSPHPDAMDLHYLAVLKQKLGEAGAEAIYQEAIRRYEDQAKRSRNYRPLLALCRADFGLYLLNQTNRFPEAAQMMAAARKEFGAETPVPFQIFTLCREADALRYAKKWRLSDERFARALRFTTVPRVGPGESHPLTAAAWKHFAWSCMEECRIKRAKAAFERAEQILSRVEKTAHDETIIDRLHIKHGLAMVERFQGRGAQALAAYRRLTPEIVAEISKLDDTAQEHASYAEIRFLLYDRLVNSLERQADCSLFGDRPDYEEAADDYRRAIRECANLPEDWRASTQVDLLYRRSIALALPSESQDLELVTRLFQQAGEIKLSTPSQSTRIVRALAATLIRTFGTARKLDCQGGSDCIFALLQQLQGVNKSLDRDELERLMFSYKVLLAGSERFGIDRLGRLRLADDLLALCQSVCQLAAGDPDLLRYLRPYFDVVFLEKKLLEPKHCKELIEVAWLASRGVPYVKPPQARPLLVMHVAAGRGYLLLDVPAGMSQCFLVDEETSLHDLVVASQSGALLPLPVAVRRALSNVEGPLVVRWRDPAISAGTCGRMLPYMLGFEMKPRRHYPEAVKIATRRGSAPSRPAPVPDEPTLDSSVPQVPEAPLIGPEPGDLQPSSRYVFPFNMTAALARGRVMDESDKYPAPSGDDIRSRKREDELTANEEVARPKR